jgi:hypothetical protein
VPAQFQDTTDTKFEGRVDAVLEMPVDGRICPNGDQLGVVEPGTGLHTTANVPDLCLIRTPEAYLDALNHGHVINWVEYTTSSINLLWAHRSYTGAGCRVGVVAEAGGAQLRRRDADP